MIAAGVTPLHVAVLLVGAGVVVLVGELIGWFSRRSIERKLDRDADVIDRRSRT